MKHEIQETKLLFSEFFKIERATVRWEQFDGTMGEYRTRYAVRRGDSVGIIPLMAGGEGRIVLVKQFRYPAAAKGSDGYLWEIPAGMVHGGERPEETAKRELREEIGAEAGDVNHLLSFYLSPGALDEKFHLFLARLPGGVRLDPVGGNPREHENLSVRDFSLPECAGMIERNEICDAKTIAALLYYYYKSITATI